MTDKESGDIKHNINNPLTIIMLNLELAKKGKKELDKEEMLKQCQRLADYVANL